MYVRMHVSTVYVSVYAGSCKRGYVCIMRLWFKKTAHYYFYSWYYYCYHHQQHKLN